MTDKEIANKLGVDDVQLQKWRILHRRRELRRRFNVPIFKRLAVISVLIFSSFVVFTTILLMSPLQDIVLSLFGPLLSNARSEAGLTALAVLSGVSLLNIAGCLVYLDDN